MGSLGSFITLNSLVLSLDLIVFHWNLCLDKLFPSLPLLVFSDLTTLLNSSFGSFRLPASQLLQPIILSLLKKPHSFANWCCNKFNSFHCPCPNPTVTISKLPSPLSPHSLSKLILILTSPRILRLLQMSSLNFPHLIIFVCAHSHFLPSGLRRSFPFPPGSSAYLSTFLQELHWISYSLSPLYL